MSNGNKDKMIDLMVSLRKIWDDRDFVLGVCVHLKTDEHIQIMKEWLNKHKDEQIESDEILLKAIEIRYGKRFEIDGLTTRY